MKLSLVLLAAVVYAAAPDQETLRYSVNWASGLSLGEAELKSSKRAQGWSLAFKIDASVPGYAVADQVTSQSNETYCAVQFEKKLAHGKRSANEVTTVEKSKAVRKTKNGGSSEISVPPCVRDALSYVFFARKELAAGRVPSGGTILFGAPYTIRTEYKGAEQVKLSDETVTADHILAEIKGPASSFLLSVYFSRDDARTPVLVKAPFPVGTLSMELVR